LPFKFKARSHSILAASAGGIFQRVAQLISSLITLPLALHTLGLTGFGVWGAATSLAWLSSLLTSGLGSALITLIPRGLATGQTEQNRGYVTASLHGGVALAALLLAMLAIARLFGVPLPSPPFLVAVIALIVNIPLSVSFELWLALQKGHMAALWGTVQTLLTLLFIVASALTGAGITLMVAAIYGAMLAANAASLAHVLYLHHHIRPYRRLTPPALRTVLTQGGLLFAVTIAGTSVTAFDNVMALAWLGPAASAQMAVAVRVCIMATGIISAVTQPFWPSFADAFAAHDHAWVRRMLKLGTAGVLLLTAAGSAFIVAFGAPLLRWWLHQDLHISAPLLLAMAVWITGMTLTNVPAALLNAALRLRAQIAILSCAALAGFALKYWAARHFGVTGILLVSPVMWFAAVGPLYLWLAWRVVTKPV
jgi:O-antigen/teichoic acid export membrane protein